MGREGGYAFKDFPHSSHRRLLALVPPAPVKILDVGTAHGYLGAALAAMGHTVVGIEADAEAARAAAAHYAAIYCEDVARHPRLAEVPFDVVVAADVLEHLADPAATLRWLVGLLAPGGRILVSVPNVAFLTVRLGLLVGRFEYQPRGILDRTHLRFFTRRSLFALLRDGGLRPRRVFSVPPPLPLLIPATARWPLRVVLEVAALWARLWPGLFAYQFVVEAEP
jgi:2-polyprenyl-3-methyl-5-hydroxy-6-metoxy-1,4-benzoquinol methylase